MKRNRYADLLRVAAISGVVYGHWLLTDVTYRNGRLSGFDALNYVSWGRWVTWPFQVMPVFFLVGGYVNALSWTAHHDRGESWTGWVRDRAMRLLWPTMAFVVVVVLAVTAARAADAKSAEIAEAGWLVALQLWFLPAYLLLIALTPALLALHRRYGPMVPAIIVAVALYRTGVMPQPAIGTGSWWELRPAWFALLTALLIPLVLAVTWAERPMLRLSAGLGAPGPWSPVLLAAGLAAAMVGLARLAIGGFAPGGRLPLFALAACAAGPDRTPRARPHRWRVSI